MSEDKDEIKDRSEDKDDIFNTEIKERTDPSARLERQLERCNALMSTHDQLGFDAAVRAALSDLPISIKKQVLRRTGEYNHIPPFRWHYTEWCLVRMGSVEDPLFRNKKGTFGYDPTEPTVRVSPIKIQDPEYTDYEDLFGIIKEELERGGGSWVRR